MTIILSLATSAQFTGGIGQGNSTNRVSAASLGVSFYLGGSDDGSATTFTSSQKLGTSFYLGGSDDGSAITFTGTQKLGTSFFTGGSDDGSATTFTGSQKLGTSFFTGGSDDGSATTFTGSQKLGTSFYTGGADDGFAMGFIAHTALPVTLVSFTAAWQKDDAVTKWITSTEINTAYFEIERSIDGNTFTSIGKVNASVNAVNARTYSFTDVKVNANYSIIPPVLYYRLKTVDKDGKFQYSAIVVLPNQQKDAIYTLYPNPASSQLTIECRNTQKKYSLTLLSSSSQKMLQKTAVSQKESINVSAFANGIYYLLITDTDTKTTQTFKILIQH